MPISGKALFINKIIRIEAIYTPILLGINSIPNHKFLGGWDGCAGTIDNKFQLTKPTQIQINAL